MTRSRFARLASRDVKKAYACIKLVLLNCRARYIKLHAKEKKPSGVRKANRSLCPLIVFRNDSESNDLITANIVDRRSSDLFLNVIRQSATCRPSTTFVFGTFLEY